MMPLPPYLEKRTNVNNLFGVYSITNDNSINIDMKETDDIYDYILRDNDVKNLGKDIEAVKRRTNMKLKKEDYLKEKNKELAEIYKKVSKRFKKKYIFYLSQGFSQNEAKKKAGEIAKQEETELLKVHKEKYPKEGKDLFN